ncbi:MAG: hypothetical protein VX899_19090 [Myxococcota bacterium]|nr:hypothetical protein [Myxococcota bacterium]
MLGLLSLLATTDASAAQVSFDTLNGKPAGISVVTATVATSEGSAVATDNLCVSPCTVDLPAGMYTFNASQSGHIALSVTVEVGEDGGTISFPEARKMGAVVGAIICCFPVGIWWGYFDPSVDDVKTSGAVRIAEY